MVKLHQILIGVVATIILTSSGALFYTGLADNYSNATGYDNSSLEGYNDQVEEINDEVNETASQIQSVQQNPLVPDLLGAALIGGIGAISNLDSVLDIMFNSFTELVDLIPLGPIGSVVVAVVSTAIPIVFFVAILLPIITRSSGGPL